MNNSNAVIEHILDLHLADLKQHFQAYRNHVYRVYHLSQMVDNQHSNKDKYAIASAFHDLGIWTENNFDYLEPSVQLAKEYLKKNDREDWIQEISLMINMHHKRTEYLGPFQKTVESFRRADWIDVSLGTIAFEHKRDEIKKISKAFPNNGFHRFLIIQTLRHFMKSPFNPLPMFKK